MRGAAPSRLAPWLVGLMLVAVTAQAAPPGVDPPVPSAPPVPGDPPSEDDEIDEEPRRLDHSLLDAVLAAHVSAEGDVDYASLQDSPGDLQRLDDYLERAANLELWGLVPEERLALYLNLHNACAVRTVVERYPIESVRAVTDFFDAPRCLLDGRSLSLNDIQNRLIGLNFTEPRVHFALTTLARSSAPLRNAAYTGIDLESQLTDQSRRFIRATTTLRTNVMEVEISRLFEWFGREFDAFGGVEAFVAAHLEAERGGQLREQPLIIVYSDFDWRLNDASGE